MRDLVENYHFFRLDGSIPPPGTMIGNHSLVAYFVFTGSNKFADWFCEHFMSKKRLDKGTTLLQADKFGELVNGVGLPSPKILASHHE